MHIGLPEIFPLREGEGVLFFWKEISAYLNEAYWWTIIEGERWCHQLDGPLAASLHNLDRSAHDVRLGHIALGGLKFIGFIRGKNIRLMPATVVIHNLWSRTYESDVRQINQNLEFKTLKFHIPSGCWMLFEVLRTYFLKEAFAWKLSDRKFKKGKSISKMS